jgi:dihydroorotase-like cyclic amidohydrolase
MIYDLVIKNGYVIDSKNAFEGLADIAIKDGKIVEFVPEKKKELKSLEYLDIKGLYLCPGLIDNHVHLTSEFGGPAGYNMLAKAGVTTATDFAGPIEEIYRDLPVFGKGLNIGCCNAILPTGKINSNNPSKKMVERFVKDRLEKGSIGIKILGGHFPLTPSAIKYVIEQCNEEKVFVAIHAGSTQTGSHIEGMKEALDLSSDNRLYVAHINAYCRGLIEEPLVEISRAIKLLIESSNIFSGSHLAFINGTSGKCLEGMPVSHVTRNCLKMGKYEVSEVGLEKAIMDGYGLVHINMNSNNDIQFLTGVKGVDCWKETETNIGISFPVNRADSNFVFASEKDGKNAFIVDIITTDGGGIPRNVLLEKGLCLVKYGAISLKEMVYKMSQKPASLLGLPNKGHLSVGSDADLTIFDYDMQKAVYSLVEGNFILYNKKVVGKRGKIVTTKYGKEFLEKSDLPYILSQPEKSDFYL